VRSQGSVTSDEANRNELPFFEASSESQLFIWRKRIPTILSPHGQDEDPLAFVKRSSPNDDYYRKAHQEIDTSLLRTRRE